MTQGVLILAGQHCVNLSLCLPLLTKLLLYLVFTFETVGGGYPGDSDGKESSCNAGGLVGKIPWRRAWQPTPVLLPGEFHGQWSLVGYSPSSHKELDITEQHFHCYTVGEILFWPLL